MTLVKKKDGELGTLYVYATPDGLEFKAKFNFTGISIGSLDADGTIKISWQDVEFARKQEYK